MAVLYILAGMNHFKNPTLYERIMPPYFLSKKSLVIVSGIAEMVLGFMLLIPEYSSIAAWLIVVMLLLFFTVHWHMLKDKKASLNLPRWLLILRLPLQVFLILWAYYYT